MKLLSVKTYPVLLWRICVLFAMEALTAPTPETSNIKVTVESLTVLYGEKESQPATREPTHKPAEVSVAAATKNTVLPIVETQATDSTHGSTAGLVVMSTAAATAAAPAATSGRDLRLLQSSTAATTAAGEGQLSHSTAIKDKHTQDQLHQQSSTTLNDKTAPAATSDIFPATAVASSPQTTSITKPEATSQLSSTVSSHESTQIFNQNLSSPSASTATTMMTNPNSEAATVFSLTSLPSATTSKTTPELSSTSHFIPPAISATSVLISTEAAGSTSTPMSISTEPPSSTVSNSSAGILNPREPKRLPVPTFKPTTVTPAAPRQVSKSPSSTEAQPCSTRGVVKNCLIIIAALAALATVFMVSTIVLCTKLSVRKHRVKKPQQATEMMCISALLPEPSYTYTRQRNPVRNGVLVIPAGGDSDDDLGDNLTLSSFLPDNDRYV